MTKRKAEPRPTPEQINIKAFNEGRAMAMRFASACRDMQQRCTLEQFASVLVDRFGVSNETAEEVARYILEYPLIGFRRMKEEGGVIQ
jgi:hypothetical protein